MVRTLFSPQTAIHILAAAIALFYAWNISQSAYVATGLQFVTPVIIIMTVHLGWLALSRSLTRGFSSVIYRRSACTAVGMAAVILVGTIVAPQPAEAAAGEIVETVLIVMFCVTIIAIIAGVIAFIIYLFAKGIQALSFSKNDDDGPSSRLFDVASLAITGVILSVASVEGITKSLTFQNANLSSASYVIDATPEQIWTAMEQATSPSFPLPNILNLFPQPIDVMTDEGTQLGALRTVQFQGREGAGELRLRVIERTEQTAVFEVLSDTSPYAMWVAHQRLIYVVESEGEGTRLTVSLEYDRLLAPSWFFTPATKGAAYLAMDVLARDVKIRAEG